MLSINYWEFAFGTPVVAVSSDIPPLEEIAYPNRQAFVRRAYTFVVPALVIAVLGVRVDRHHGGRYLLKWTTEGHDACARVDFFI